MSDETPQPPASSPPIAWNGFMESLVPEAARLKVASAIAGAPQNPLQGSASFDDLMDAIKASVEQPKAAARGFTAGATEGALGLLSPMNIASIAGGPVARAVGPLARSAAQTIGMASAADRVATYLPQLMRGVSLARRVHSMTKDATYAAAGVAGARALEPDEAAIQNLISKYVDEYSSDEYRRKLSRKFPLLFGSPEVAEQVITRRKAATAGGAQE